MHDTAYEFGRLFFERYIIQTVPIILDVGSADINGSLRVAARHNSLYVGVDITAGNGVDCVLEDPHVLPFESNIFDAVISTSCFEHDDMFWLTFQEMARVVAPGGYIYINAPSNGMVHRFPSDFWRFYPDSAMALARWSARHGIDLTVLESFMAPPENDRWLDCVMVFGKAAAPAEIPIAFGRTDLILGQSGAPTDINLPKEADIPTRVERVKGESLGSD